jgi:methylmalonyl-CoA mutase N-terminal domain/subunit
MKIDPALERAQVERVRAFRATRDAAAHAAALARIDAAARGDDNLLPVLIDAVKAGATVGEMSDVLRGVWGEHRETLTI